MSVLHPTGCSCGCCDTAVPLAPASIANRPGLSQIAWRPGSYATFRQTMIDHLARGPRNPLDPGDPRWPTEVRSALAALTTRDDADYGIMLLDLFAAVSDVLAFYSERQANEMFLRTARQRDSLLRLVRLIGYRPSAGIASTTALAFTLDAGATVAVGKGLRVMSVPGQDERPQTFETIGAIKADARLNDLPVYGAPQPIDAFPAGSARVPIRVRPNPLVRGDSVALVGNNEFELNEVVSVDTEADGEHLRLARPITVTGTTTVGFKLKRQLNLFGHDVPSSYSHYNPALLPQQRWTTKSVGTDYFVGLLANLSRYALDRKVDGLRTGTLLLVDCGPTAAPTRYAFAFVTGIEQDTATLGPLSDSVDYVKLQPVAVLVWSEGFVYFPNQGLPQIPDIRRTRVYELESRAIVPRIYRYPDTLTGQTLHIRSDHLDDPLLLEKKRWIAVSDGSRRHLARITGTTVLPAGIDGVSHIAVGFAPGLPYGLAATRMNGNVAPASHGETQRDETLGHGDSTKAFQKFRLQRNPLTRVTSASRIEPANELGIRVNGELWQEAASFFGRGPNERIYTARTSDDGVTTVSFGDGRTGARLPSGAANVVARYRTGLGRDGRLKADQLTTLLTRPVGLRAVTNPLPTDGGDDPETLATARSSAPASVRTFGRAISLMDFEDVARQTALVARARANWAWIGLERAIQLTIAGAEGARLSPAAMETLVTALRSVRDPNHLLIVGNLWRVPVTVTARLLRDPAHEADVVEANARASLTERFAFDRQPLGRPVHLSHVVAALQQATGVSAVDVDHFHIKGAAGWTALQLTRRSATSDSVQSHIRIFDARPLVPPALLDPLGVAGLALDPSILALPAEQAFIEAPATDVTLSVVEEL